jgi:hypothetical protein
MRFFRVKNRNLLINLREGQFPHNNCILAITASDAVSVLNTREPPISYSKQFNIPSNFRSIILPPQWDFLGLK